MSSDFHYDWKQAEAWEVLANADEGTNPGIEWKWDCFFKLDYDGELLSVSSRFYPPGRNKSGGWEGDVCIYLMDDDVSRRSFCCPDLDILKNEVELYVKEYAQKVKEALVNAGLINIKEGTSR